MPNRAFIGIGTNLGNRPANYSEALQRLGKLRATRVVRQSSVYETEPVGDVEGPFLNGAVEVETELGPEELMLQLLAIERAMGRRRNSRSRARYQPRIIDLDLLFYNQESIDTADLQLPHPRLHERRFVLVPMSELSPALVHPKLDATISKLLAGLKSRQRVVLTRAILPKAATPQGEVNSR
jgi:2-amino-4-hydroxy-6-hydroxymethyldihydropteridine diphosphokinase